MIWIIGGFPSFQPSSSISRVDRRNPGGKKRRQTAPSHHGSAVHRRRGGLLPGLFPPIGCQQRSGKVVPDAEDGAGQGGDRVKMGGGQGDGQTGILHSHLHRDGPAARLVLPQQAGGKIPQSQAGQVVQDYRQEDDRGGQQLIGAACDDAGDDGDDGEDGDGRQGG